MGNVASKRKKNARPSVVRADIPDNEISTATATSVNSILVNSKQQQQQQPQKSPPQQQPQPQLHPNSIETNDVNEQQTVHSSNQLTLNSQNQLTATSIRSIGWNLDIDECINRLLDVGTKNKVTKSTCFRNSEIMAICRAAQQVFLSQPVSCLCLVDACY